MIWYYFSITTNLIINKFNMWCIQEIVYSIRMKDIPGIWLNCILLQVLHSNLRITLKSTLCGPLNELCMQQTTSFRYIIRFVLVHHFVVVYPKTLFSNYPTLPTNNPLFSINFSIKTTLHTTTNPPKQIFH